MALNVLELLEAIGPFSAFWAFVFSRKYRAAQVQEWKTRSWPGRCVALIEASVATVIGTSPIWLLYVLLR